MSLNDHDPFGLGASILRAGHGRSNPIEESEDQLLPGSEQWVPLDGAAVTEGLVQVRTELRSMRGFARPAVTWLPPNLGIPAHQPGPGRLSGGTYWPIQPTAPPSAVSWKRFHWAEVYGTVPEAGQGYFELNIPAAVDFEYLVLGPRGKNLAILNSLLDERLSLGWRYVHEPPTEGPVLENLPHGVDVAMVDKALILHCKAAGGESGMATANDLSYQMCLWYRLAFDFIHGWVKSGMRFPLVDWMVWSWRAYRPVPQVPHTPAIPVPQLRRAERQLKDMLDSAESESWGQDALSLVLIKWVIGNGVLVGASINASLQVAAFVYSRRLGSSADDVRIIMDFVSRCKALCFVE